MLNWRFLACRRNLRAKPRVVGCGGVPYVRTVKTAWGARSTLQLLVQTLRGATGSPIGSSHVEDESGDQPCERY